MSKFNCAARILIESGGAKGDTTSSKGFLGWPAPCFSVSPSHPPHASRIVPGQFYRERYL